MRPHLDYPEIPFHALLQRAATSLPDKTAIVFQERRLTFGEWDRQANQVAHALLDLRMERGPIDKSEAYRLLDEWARDQGLEQ